MLVNTSVIGKQWRVLMSNRLAQRKICVYILKYILHYRKPADQTLHRVYTQKFIIFNNLLQKEAKILVFIRNFCTI